MFKRRIKIVVDAAMAVLMIVLMGYQKTGNTVHEFCGIGLFVAMALHLWLNRDAMKASAKLLRMPKKNTAGFIMALTDRLLLLDMIILIFSSMVISIKVFSFLGLMATTRLWTYLHSITAQIGLFLMGFHLGFHWKPMMTMFQKAMHLPKGTMPKWIARILTAILSVLGFLAFLEQGVAEKFVYRVSAEESGTPKIEVAKSKRVSKDLKLQRSFSEPIQDGETLQKFLERLTCTGCSLHCPLSDPQCGVGEDQAYDAEKYYKQQATAKTTTAAVTTNAMQTGTTSSGMQGGTVSTIVTTSDGSAITTMKAVTTKITTSSGAATNFNAALARLFCTGCGKHCPLSAPQCGIGVQQAKEALKKLQIGSSAEELGTTTIASGGNSASVAMNSNQLLKGLTCTGCSKHCPLTAPLCAIGVAQAQAVLNGKSQNSVSVSDSERTSDESNAITALTNENGTVIVPSLSEYLSGLTCTGCSKHCPLSAPLCAIGEQQAEEAREAYQAAYSNQISTGNSSGFQDTTTVAASVERTEDVVPDEDALLEYLSGLICTGCSRHCPLSAPLCSIGEGQAQEAKAVFLAAYDAAGDDLDLNPDAPGGLVTFGGYTAIFGLYTAAGHYTATILRRRKKSKPAATKESK